MLMSRIKVSVIPPDLRIINKPLIERLSTNYAGFSGDDAMDIKIIRDEWIRSKTRSLARKGTGSLSLRIGTFNVNGKMPTQDLSSWVQGTTASTSDAPKDTASSPRIENLSPSSSRFPGDSQFILNSTTSSFSNAERTSVGPDVIILGFQELDLSTEALIYSTGTAREDAWYLAVFAALGEKAAQYEKVVQSSSEHHLIR